MNKETLIKTIVIPALSGLATGTATVILTKTLAKHEVKKKTKHFNQSLENIRAMAIENKHTIADFMEKNETLEKTTIRSMTPEDFVNQLKKSESNVIKKIDSEIGKVVFKNITEYSKYISNQIDEVYERLEAAEQYINQMSDKLLRDDVGETKKVVEEISEENVAEEIKKGIKKENKNDIGNSLNKEHSNDKSNKNKSKNNNKK